MGIGEAIASRLAEDGAYLMLLARNEVSATVQKNDCSRPRGALGYYSLTARHTAHSIGLSHQAEDLVPSEQVVLQSRGCFGLRAGR